eukprot:1025546-Prymnesium_polylepis.3
MFTGRRLWRLSLTSTTSWLVVPSKVRNTASCSSVNAGSSLAVAAVAGAWASTCAGGGRSGQGQWAHTGYMSAAAQQADRWRSLTSLFCKTGRRGDGGTVSPSRTASSSIILGTSPRTSWKKVKACPASTRRPVSESIAVTLRATGKSGSVCTSLRPASSCTTSTNTESSAMRPACTPGPCLPSTASGLMRILRSTSFMTLEFAMGVDVVGRGGTSRLSSRGSTVTEGTVSLLPCSSLYSMPPTCSASGAAAGSGCSKSSDRRSW